MERYPLLEINLKHFYNNTKVITTLCNSNNIKLAGVVKGFGGIVKIAEQMAMAGCEQIASSRIEQLKELKNSGIDKKLMLIRIPMESELKDVVLYSDICLVSEKKTLLGLNDEASKHNKKLGIVLMYDLGDLREGIFNEAELVELACFVEKDLENLTLLGIGSNLSCYGSIMPTFENLSKLSEAAEKIENILKRKLEIISGGSTTTLPLLLSGQIPKKINHLRIGEAIINAHDLSTYYSTTIDGICEDTFVLKAQIVELNEKPTHPIGKMMVNAFGEKVYFEDKGIRKRAIVALGNQDVGDYSKLLPKDKDIKPLGASSDHTILDIHDCKIEYKLGDLVEFNLLYQGMLFSSLSSDVHKKIISD